ncbi:LysR family transcriptional regulator [Halomonas dongshanensis]|uniref:LysR family transcriptional regulator n=1 Tax=Halomonas dongshanensis TaxID=2890835 RepID=A0ABT2EA65_9GAMM|nr:LysR family transcriptional regulator [Halomonas dongshanensis]MCS2608477.1 LysR family transcriptional regulator [Halomonas dongshanensis]
MNNVTARQLEAIIAVADMGSFTEAAEKLHLSQPSLSQLVRQLEQTLGVRLFERTTRRVSLSVAGREFLPVAERVLSRLERGMQNMRAFAKGQQGQISFAALLTVGGSLIPAAMAAFQARYPNIGLEYLEESDEPIYQQVMAGDVDFGVSVAPSNLDDVNFHPIYKDYLYFVCAPDHPLAGEEEVSWHQIVEWPFIAMKPRTSMRGLTEQGFAITGKPMEPVQVAGYQSTILGMVANNIGVSALPSSLKLMFRRDDVCLIPIRERLYRDIGVLTSRRRELTPAARGFIDVLMELVEANRSLLPSSE